MSQLIADLQSLDMLNDRLAHLLEKIMHRYTRGELIEAGHMLKIKGIPPGASKWDILKYILCDVSDDSWLLSPE
jgi:hypothetical protein